MKLIYSSSAINSWALWWFLLLPRPVRNLPGPEPRSLAWKCSKPKMSSTPMKLEGLAPVPQQNAEHRKTGAELEIWNLRRFCNSHQQKNPCRQFPWNCVLGGLEVLVILKIPLPTCLGSGGHSGCAEVLRTTRSASALGGKGLVDPEDDVILSGQQRVASPMFPQLFGMDKLGGPPTRAAERR